MSDLKEIKERIFLEEKIEDILLALECQSISTEQHGDLFTCQLPAEFNSNNKRAVQIKNNESLTSYVRNKGVQGDIFSLIAFIMYEAVEFEDVKGYLYEIKAWIVNLFEWDEYLETDFETPKKRKKIKWTEWLKPFRKRRKEKENMIRQLTKQNQPLDKNIMNRYIQKPHIEFIKSGINCQTQKIFEVAFDMDSERVIYPIYDNNGFDIIGIKGRYVGNNKTVAENRKYLFLFPCDKSILLYNLHRAYPYINEKKEVLVFESAKSCMLAWQYGYKNCVSIEGSELSQVQAYLLKKLDCQITFCLDKDMSIDFIEKQAKMIRNRICFALLDRDNYLSEKDSPIDKGKKVWEILLFKNKYKLNCYDKVTRRKEKAK